MPDFRIIDEKGNTKAAPIPLFRWVYDGNLSLKVKKKFSLGWKPIFDYVDKCGKFEEFKSTKYKLTAT